MAIFSNSIIPAAAAAADDVVTKSLRFSEATQHWLRGGTGSTGSSNGTWTLSYWIKRAALEGGGRSHPDHNFQMFYWTGLGTGESVVGFQHGGTDAGKLRFAVGGGSTYYSSGVFRDLSAWAHILVSVSSGTATVKYNGETVISGATGVPTWGTYLQISRWSTDDYSSFGGYFADVYGVDGTALDYTDFTSTDATTGQLKPIAYSGSVGTDGFHLDFEDDTDIGKDVSGEGNDFTEEGNLAPSDVVNDTPTDNHATWNPLIYRRGGGHIFTYSEGNTKAVYTGGVGHAQSTIASSGRHYAEFDCSGGNSAISGAGVVRARWDDGMLNSYANSYGGAVFGSDGDITSPSGVTSHTAVGSNRQGVAFDGAANKVDFYIVESDGTMTLQKSLTSSDSIDFDGEATFTISSHDSGATTFNGYFSSDKWWGEAPTIGGNATTALSTANLPAPTIAKPSEHFDIKTWTGTATSPTAAAKVLDFPWSFATDGGLVWQKMRNTTGSHYLFDTVRGDNKGLYSNSDAVEEGSGAAYYTQDFDGSGDYSIQQDFDGGGNGNEVNLAGNTYVAWSWKAGTSFDAGGGAGTGSKNVDAGFSIAKWTGDDSGGMGGYSQEVSHGLTVAPEMIIAKNRTDSVGGNGDWMVYHKDLDSGDLIKLNSSNAAYTPTGYTVISGVTDAVVEFDSDSMEYDYLNYDGDDYIAYFMASKAGYSKVGSYEGNNSADGPFVYCGFRPRWIVCKRIDGTSPWAIIDTTRDPYNDTDAMVAADTSTAETSYAATSDFDILSNGFKLRHNMTYGYVNQSDTHIFYAVAESPFKYASAR